MLVFVEERLNREQRLFLTTKYVDSVVIYLVIKTVSCRRPISASFLGTIFR